ncbi:MAG TPA: hypothetical protein DD757_02750 [Alcanivorax sp.]|jgi:predicted transposase YdaD|uniref:Rpn family recombination-promoting nuclease/putative transposase n=1 Tax=Marinobacter sp. UBA2678 TaxID=1946815 RepID=UPI000C92ECF3|nr:Rpn family recombination-promoting nuclease/putative transposase [Marinobacter sp. UBA2678]MAD71475.1 hypothetical protein [Alcanivorax sp.]HBP74766.1 hypothetical protein [Alcanivorax sp.]HCI12099.1 hypothetical protein [Alcanivorax sp.]|tara:strand:+ start:671 stop:1243 length:573 start_codon:yes stop_codon:yes gene_type:complete
MDDHDTSYRLLFSHAEMVRDLLTGFVPESWIAELDLNSLEKMNGSYVSDDLRSRHNDAIWRVRWGQEWIYIYLRRDYVEWLRRRLRRWAPTVNLPEIHDLQETYNMVRDTVQEWKDQHHQTGLQQGLEQGMEQGSTNEARAILRRQLVRRFGDVPAEVDARLGRATRTELEGWIDRPYEVDTLEDVFRPS